MSTAGPVDEVDAELTALQALEVEAGGFYVRQCEALLAVWDSAPADSTVGTHPQVLAEVAGLLQLHPASVGSRLGVALALRRHPTLSSLLAAGRLGVAHTLAAVEELDALGDDDLTGTAGADDTDYELGGGVLAARVLHEVLLTDGHLGWQGTPAQLRRALRRAAVRLDPAAAARRRAAELAQRTGIRLRPLRDGLAAWTATGPATQLTATDRLLEVLSGPAGPDDTRSRGQRQLDALLVALIARAGTAVDLELQIAIPVQVTASSPVVGCPPEPLALQLDLTPDLIALLTDTTTPTAEQAQREQAQREQAQPEQAQREQTQATLDLVEPEEVETELAQPELAKPELAQPEPAEPDRAEVEPVEAEPVEPCRAEVEPFEAELVVAELVEPELTDVELSECGEPQPHPADPDGDTEPELQPIEPEAGPRVTERRLQVTRNEPEPTEPGPTGPESTGPEPGERQLVRPRAVKPGEQPTPTTPAPPPRPPLRLGRRRGVPELLDHGPVDLGLLAELLDDPHGLPVGIRRLQLRRICLDPTGQAVAIDARALPLAQLLQGQGDRAEILRRLITDLPTPPPASAGYQPTAAQTRLVRARDTTCTFPGCARRSRRSELDHRKRYRDGGPTSVGNLHPLCKHHHRLKHDGWACTRTPDGTTTWTSPRGQTLTGQRH